MTPGKRRPLPSSSPSSGHTWHGPGTGELTGRPRSVLYPRGCRSGHAHGVRAGSLACCQSKRPTSGEIAPVPLGAGAGGGRGRVLALCGGTDGRAGRWVAGRFQWVNHHQPVRTLRPFLRTGTACQGRPSGRTPGRRRSEHHHTSLGLGGTHGERRVQCQRLRPGKLRPCQAHKCRCPASATLCS